MPVGIIQAAVGGTPAQTWLPWETVQAHSELEVYVERWQQLLADYPELETDPAAVYDGWVEAFREFRSQLVQYRQGEMEQRPQPLETPNPRRAVISGYYNGMIHPLASYVIRGAIWYQGEANSGSPEEARRYVSLFRALIGSWRAQWNEPDLPFLFVQLPEFESRGEGWWWLRDSQRRVALEVPSASMFVSIGYGDLQDIHPTQKQPVGRGLARMALRQVYDQPGPIMGPMATTMEIRDGAATIEFEHVHEALAAAGGQSLDGFEIAGADGQFHSAEATLVGPHSIRLALRQVETPVAARYGFASDPILTLVDEKRAACVTVLSRTGLLGNPLSSFSRVPWKGAVADAGEGALARHGPGGGGVRTGRVTGRTPAACT